MWEHHATGAKPEHLLKMQLLDSSESAWAAPFPSTSYQIPTLLHFYQCQRLHRAYCWAPSLWSVPLATDLISWSQQGERDYGTSFTETPFPQKSHMHWLHFRCFSLLLGSERLKTEQSFVKLWPLCVVRWRVLFFFWCATGTLYVNMLTWMFAFLVSRYVSLWILVCSSWPGIDKWIMILHFFFFFPSC